mmetsp:Transcript_19125/g.53132  ORF Transcript_19125/g.53132 Transcript_19125/m.53132 type:complete len:296 (-) Transcript_19125:435-1322(-)
MPPLVDLHSFEDGNSGQSGLPSPTTSRLPSPLSSKSAPQHLGNVPLAEVSCENSLTETAAPQPSMLAAQAKSADASDSMSPFASMRSTNNPSAGSVSAAAFPKSILCNARDSPNNNSSNNNNNNESSNTKGSKRRRRHASVSFSQQVLVRPIHVRKTIEHEDCASTWYSTSELRQVRVKAARLVIQATKVRGPQFVKTISSSGKHPSILAVVDEPTNSRESLHGLENMFRPNSQQRKVTRHNLTETILMQQQLELLSGPDAEWMAVLCSNMTAPSRQKAHNMAMDLQSHVRSLWR